MGLKDIDFVQNYSLSDFLPLIGVFSAVILATAVLTVFKAAFAWISIAQTFMGFLFLALGGLKAYNLNGFANAYQNYDLVAKKSRLYAKIYPFLELGLGASYVLSPILLSSGTSILLWTNAFTAILMTVGAAGVFNELRKENRIPCACLGDVFHVPMTGVTLLEDLLMAVMALTMIFVII